MKINGRVIGDSESPYVIAELSANHNGSLGTALKLVELAKKSGADAIKLQTYTADTLTIDASSPDFVIDSGLWKGRTLYELYDQAHTPWEWHPAIFAKAREVDISIFSSPFDLGAIELLESLGAPAYKIASFELIDHELVAAVARTKKPLILSTGLANYEEIAESLEVALSSGATSEQIALLHCLSAYPADPAEYKLHTIQELKKSFAVEVGLSDHSLGNSVAVSAVALGANLVEKHFTSDKEAGGPDDSFSMDANDLQSLKLSLDVAWKARGFDNYRTQPGEAPNLRFRRSLYVVEDIPSGTTISQKQVRAIRPGYGVAPKHLPDIIGKTYSRALKRGEPITPSILSELTTEN